MPINQLPTRVQGLDEVPGGGLPEYSFNLIAGAPGTGKTMLSQQIMFALALPSGVHFTVVGEPPLKMLRYQQQFTCFDTTRLGTSVHYVNLSNATLSQGLEAVLETIQREVEQSAQVSWWWIRSAPSCGPRMAALTCRASWNAWRFSSRAGRRRPFLSANIPRLKSPRTPSYRCRRRPVAVPAHRPQLWPAQAPGDENARTGSAARATHPAHHAGWSARIPEDHPTYGGGRPAPKNVCRPGVAALDEMLGGGILAWDSLLVTGTAGSGKSALAT